MLRSLCLSGLDTRVLLNRGYSFVLSFQLIFALLQLLDFFRVKYHPMIQRRPSSRYFELGFSLVVPMVALMVLWFAINFLLGRFSLIFSIAPLFLCLHSVELGVSATSLFMCLMGVVFLSDRGGFADTLLWVLSVFLGLGVLHWGVLKPLGVPNPFINLINLMYNVHHLLRRVFPVLLLPFLFFWAIKPVINVRFNFPELTISEGKFNRFSVLLLVFSVYLSIFSALYPYFSTVNPGDVDFGVDIPAYEHKIQVLTSDDAWFNSVLRDTRAFFYMVFFSFRFATGLDTHSALRFFPVLLNPLFVIASYYFSYEFYRNHRFASWCAFLSSTGLTLTSSMFAYYLTSLLALCLVFVSLGLLFRAFRVQDRKSLFGASVLGVLLVFTHPWTMDQYVSGLVFLFGYLLYRRGEQYKVRSLYLVGYFGVIGLAELSKILFFKSVGGAAASETVLLGLIGIDEILRDALKAFPFALGGTLSNALLILLGTIGIYQFRVKDHREQYLVLLVLLSSLVYIVSKQARKMRLILNIPFGFFGALVLYVAYERRHLPLMVFTLMYSLFYTLLSVGSLVW